MGHSWIYAFLYYLLHKIYTIFELIFFLPKRIYSVISKYRQIFLSTNDKEKDFISYKIPNHLTLLLGQEKISYSDLSNIIIWCIASHVNFVSLFDPRGELKRNQLILAEEINKRKEDSDNIIWHNSPATGFKNGYIGRKIHIKILSPEDGKTTIVNYVKNNLKTGNNVHYTVSQIDEDLRKQFEFPDPDLGIYFGKTFSVRDYPPWQIRVTEFFNVESHRDISLSKFKDVLRCFSRCEQRLGI